MGKKKGKNKTITETIEDSVPLEADVIAKRDDLPSETGENLVKRSKSQLLVDKKGKSEEHVITAQSKSKSFVYVDGDESKPETQSFQEVAKTRSKLIEKSKTSLHSIPSGKVKQSIGEVPPLDFDKRLEKTGGSKSLRSKENKAKKDGQAEGSVSPSRKKRRKNEGNDKLEQKIENTSKSPKKKKKKARSQNESKVSKKSSPSSEKKKKKKPKGEARPPKIIEEEGEGAPRKTNKKKRGSLKDRKRSKSIQDISISSSSSSHVFIEHSISNTLKTDSKKKRKNKAQDGHTGFQASSSSGSSSYSTEFELAYQSSQISKPNDEAIITVTKTKKKGKKEKKKVKEKLKEPKLDESEPDEQSQAEDDVMAEINRMKAMADAQAAGEDLETTSIVTTATTKSKKSKKKRTKKAPKKKLSKKDKLRLAAEMAEKARIEAEQEAARLAEEERIRLEEERKAAIEKEKRETVEQQIRMEQLEIAFDYMTKVFDYNRKLDESDRRQRDWTKYVTCGRLPDPTQCDVMNTYLHLWENVMEETTVVEASRRTTDVIQLLDELDDLVDTVKDVNVLANWKWVRQLFRDHQWRSLDVATYRLLRDIEHNLNRIDIPTADFQSTDDYLTLCLWLRVQLPNPMPNPRKPPRPRIEIDFKPMNITVQFPTSIDGDKTAIRAMYLRYDHLSDLCQTFAAPATPWQYEMDLYEFTKREWRAKMLYKYENRIITPRVESKEDTVDESIRKDDNDEEVEEHQSEKVIGPDDDVPVVPYRKLEPTASEFIIDQEERMYTTIKKDLIKTVPDEFINLRKYTIIGGVYVLNLLKQPPQPQDFVTMEMNLTPLYVPKELEVEDYYVDYVPPEPPEPNVRRLPEEIEEELKRQEQELDRLMLITMTWPNHVIFLELPLVCRWDFEQSRWTKKGIHDLKHNEEKGQLTFRTGQFGIYALAAYRYANLPYQAWEIRPEADGTVTVQITAAILMVEFSVNVDGKVALSQLQNSTNNALQDIVGIFMKLPKLMKKLQMSGVDLFPAFDAFCYVDGTCEKHWPTERHLYFDMAHLALCFNFAWSRWNLPAGRRNIVMQMREYNVDKMKQKNHSMCHVTPMTAAFVDCTEVSQTFSEEGIENMKFYSDVFHLMKGTSGMIIRNKVAEISMEMVNGLFNLLVATRVLSFS